MAISSWWAGEIPAAATRSASASAAPTGPIPHTVDLFGRRVGPASEIAGASANAPAISGLPLVRLYPLPSPCPDSFEVDFWLSTTADVRLDLFDARGRKVLGVIRWRLTGNCPHRISLTLEGLNLPLDKYTCQLRILRLAESHRGSQPTTI